MAGGSSFKHFVLLLLAAIALGVVLLAFSAADFAELGKGLVQLQEPECVGVIRIEGDIDSLPQSNFFAGQSLSERIADALDKAAEDSAVGSVLFVVNSPGGSGAAAKEIYDSVAASAKPVVAYLGEVAASAGYYVASPADLIVANPHVITGSIGARAEILNYQELFNKLGLRVDALKTGEFKDLGAGYRNLTEKEKLVIQRLLNESLDYFKQDVEAGRGSRLNRKKFAELLDARILTARQALDAGLVDEIGSREDALRAAGRLGNVTSEEGKRPAVCELEERRGLGALLSGLSAGFARGLVEGFAKPRVSLRYELA